VHHIEGLFGPAGHEEDQGLGSPLARGQGVACPAFAWAMAASFFLLRDSPERS
jgi:hypothetical protein